MITENLIPLMSHDHIPPPLIREPLPMFASQPLWWEWIVASSSSLFLSSFIFPMFSPSGHINTLLLLPSTHVPISCWVKERKMLQWDSSASQIFEFQNWRDCIPIQVAIFHTRNINILISTIHLILQKMSKIKERLPDGQKNAFAPLNFFKID